MHQTIQLSLSSNRSTAIPTILSRQRITTTHKQQHVMKQILATDIKTRRDSRALKKNKKKKTYHTRTMRETEWLLTDSEIVKDVRVDRERDGKIRERIVLSKISVCDLKFQHDVVDTFGVFKYLFCLFFYVILVIVLQGFLLINIKQEPAKLSQLIAFVPFENSHKR